MSSRKFTFSGKVQGIGFRFTAQMLARKYNILGWVKNNDDGSVSLVAQGTEENIKKLLNHLKNYFQDNIEEIEEIEEKEDKEQGFTSFTIQ